MRTESEIRQKVNEFLKRLEYLSDFLETLSKENNLRIYVDKELIVLKKEVDALNWVLNDKDDLPFKKSALNEGVQALRVTIVLPYKKYIHS